MKRFLSVLLALALAFTVVLPAFAVPAGTSPWDAKSHTFKLTSAPGIIFLEQESNENGTWVTAHYRASGELKALADLYYSADENEDRMFADMLGTDQDDIGGCTFRVGVQFAYSFDGGANWVNTLDEDPESLYYEQPTEYDLDDDGIYEYDDLPNKNIGICNLYNDIRLFDGAGSCFYAAYKDSGEAKAVIDKHNRTLLQGRGEYQGDYDPDGDKAWKGCMVDFNKETISVKARYRVFTHLSTNENAGNLEFETVTYSAWSGVSTFNNAKASPEAQNCVPDKAALLTDNAPTLELLAVDRYEDERDGETVKAANHRLAVRWPAATETALVRYAALSEEKREEYVDEERYEPSLCFELRVNDGPWYILERWGDPYVPYAEFDDNYYGFYQKLEAAGYQTNDRVCVRAVLLGHIGVDDEIVENESEYDIYRFVLGENEAVRIRTGYSDPAELNLTGKFTIRYETNGGSFPYGSHQLEQFDEDTLVNVDLTSGDYIPAREHFTFNGWFTTKDFAKGTQIKSFNTAEKASRTYYAKWMELPFRTVSYDFGAVTDSVYNPNRDRIYTDDGEVTINDVEYSGAKFLGWYDAAQGGSKVTSLVYASMKGDVTLYARWELPAKTITYAGAGKDYTNNAKNPASYQINPGGANETLIYAPEKTGYLFDGWYPDKDLNNGKLPYSEEKGAYLLNESEDVTLYAKWILGRWDIVYVLGLEDAWNGGNPDNYTYGNGILLQSPTRTGYTFDGWFADMAFKEKVTEIKGTDTGVKTLYAKWTAIPYKLNYDLRDPDADKFFNNSNPATRCIDDEIVLQPLTPAVKLYKFLGWYDNVNYDGDPVTKIAAGTDKDATLYAKLFKYSWGDVDFDGRVTAADARLILRYSVKLEEFTPEMQAWADVDAPSAERKITAADARLVLRMSVKLETAEGLNLPETPPGF